MKLKKFYEGELPATVLEKLDDEYKKNLAEMCTAVSTDMWTAEQQKVQKKMIISLLAKYRTFLNLGVPQEKAFALTQKWSNNSAQKINKFIKLFSRLPNFQKLLSKMFRKQMSTPGLWDHQFVRDDKEELVVDITKCLWKETCDFFDYPEICKLFCDNDWILFGDLKKMHMERVGTLGLGAEKCDFKFVFDENNANK